MTRPGVALTAVLEDPAFYAGDPFPHYARLRADAPMAWHEAHGYWVASRHAEVMEVSRDPELFCSRQGILSMEIGVDYGTPPTMMHTDPPDHTRYRKLVSPGFRPSIIKAFEPIVRERVRALLDPIVSGVDFDFTKLVAIPLALQIIADFLGIPDDKSDRFFDWSEASIPGANDWTDEHRAELQAEMQAYLLELTLTRRGQNNDAVADRGALRDDITSVLANSVVDGESLRDDEIVMFQNQLLVAGNETTRNTMSAGIWELALKPSAWQRIRSNAGLIPTTVEEFLRWSTAVIAFMRTATRATQLGGVTVAAGEPVVMLYASANRDEEVFGPTADTFDVARDPNPHVAFGFGHHFCIGAALARLEIRVLLEEMRNRYTHIEPAGEIERTRSSIIAGVVSTPVRFVT
jgi:cytochrome P450